MPTPTSFKVTISVESDQRSVSVPVGVDLLREIAAHLADHEENTALFGLLARHPSASIRQEIARKDSISRATVLELSADPDAGVLRSVCESRSFTRYASTDTVLRLIERDAQSAKIVADHLDDFPEHARPILVAAFCESSDPELRRTVIPYLCYAVHDSINQALLRRLSNDSDPDVANAAKDELTDQAGASDEAAS